MSEQTNDGYKEVYFDQYCPSCQYGKTAETEDPCYDCLQEPANLNSHKPVKYKEKVN